MAEGVLGGLLGAGSAVIMDFLVKYGVWAFIGASAMKGLILYFLGPAEAVTPAFVLYNAPNSPLDVAVIAVVAAATITLANFVIYLIARVIGFRIVISRGWDQSRKWRFLEWIIREHGRISMVLLRITPVIGTWAAIPAGIVRLRIRIFLIYSFIGFFLYEALWGFAAWYLIEQGMINQINLDPVLFLINTTLGNIP